MADTTLVDSQALVQQLMQVEDQAAPFLTAYLDTTFRSRELKGELRLFLKHKRLEVERKYQDAADYHRMLAMVDWVEAQLDRLAPSTQGWAVFMREADGFLKTFESPLPFQNEMTFEPVPNLRQLLQLSEDHESLLAIFIDSRTAKIFEVALNDIIAEQTIESEVQGWHKQGGWSQLKYQHHIQEQKEQHYGRVAEALNRMVDSGSYARVVLLGEEENVAALKRHLPERTLRYIVDSLPMDKYESNHHLVARLQTLLEQIEREQENEALAEVLDQAYAGGFATFGVSETLRATQLGQVDRLYVLGGIELDGWRCLECGLFGGVFNSPKKGCPYCGKPVSSTSLIEELILSVKRQDGEIDFIHDHPILRKLGGLAARLRFKI